MAISPPELAAILNTTQDTSRFLAEAFDTLSRESDPKYRELAQRLGTVQKSLAGLVNILSGSRRTGTAKVALTPLQLRLVPIRLKKAEDLLTQLEQQIKPHSPKWATKVYEMRMEATSIRTAIEAETPQPGKAPLASVTAQRLDAWASKVASLGHADLAGALCDLRDDPTPTAASWDVAARQAHGCGYLTLASALCARRDAVA